MVKLIFFFLCIQNKLCVPPASGANDSLARKAPKLMGRPELLHKSTLIQITSRTIYVLVIRFSETDLRACSN